MTRRILNLLPLSLVLVCMSHSRVALGLPEPMEGMPDRSCDVRMDTLRASAHPGDRAEPVSPSGEDAHSVAQVHDGQIHQSNPGNWGRVFADVVKAAALVFGALAGYRLLRLLWLPGMSRKEHCTGRTEGY